MNNSTNGTAGIIQLSPPAKTGIITFREYEVFCGILDDLSNEKIGERLFITDRTVETHRAKLYQKTGTKTVVQLIKYALKNRWIDAEGNIALKNIFPEK